MNRSAKRGRKSPLRKGQFRVCAITRECEHIRVDRNFPAPRLLLTWQLATSSLYKTLLCGIQENLWLTSKKLPKISHVRAATQGNQNRLAVQRSASFITKCILKSPFKGKFIILLKPSSLFFSQWNYLWRVALMSTRVNTKWHAELAEKTCENSAIDCYLPIASRAIIATLV